MNKRRTVNIALIVVTTLTVAFIFSNSLASSEQSNGQSDWVMGCLHKLLNIQLPSWFVRKAAHFTEFAVLGTELAVLKHRLIRPPFTAALLSGLLVALTDETLQLFSGRTSSVTDVWIDFSGVVCGMLMVAAVCFVISRAKNRQ